MKKKLTNAQKLEILKKVRNKTNENYTKTIMSREAQLAEFVLEKELKNKT
jgi:hypothetical protein